jgi:CubicO group peptidase (beta-lactamase class C family)
VSTKSARFWLLLIAVPPAVIATFVVALYTYVRVTTEPIHPEPHAVPVSTQSPPAAEWATAVEQAKQIARADLLEQNLPGLSVAVGVNGRLVWAEGLGWASLEHRHAVTPATRFRLAGTSMALTSAAVGLLIEKDQLTLDEEIQKYVPEFPKKQWPVTLRQVMGHLAGIRNDAGDEAPIGMRCARTIDGLKLDNFAARDLRFEPGTEYRYSTYGWVLVSAAVEAAAGEPFFAFMRSRIFEPLGMPDTIPDNWTEPIPNRATFYFPRFAADTRYGPQSVREGDHSCWAGAAAYLSTPSDLVRFGMAMNSGTLLRPDTVRMLQTPQALRSDELTMSGLGWRIETTALGGSQTRLAGQQDERSIGGSSSLITYPDRGIAVAVMTNTTFADTWGLAKKLAEPFASHTRRP